VSTAREDINKSLNYLHPTNELIELRIICPAKEKSNYWKGFAGGKEPIVSGWYADREELANLATGVDDNVKAKGIYVTLNPCDEDLYARSADCLKLNEHVTADEHVNKHTNLLIDVDPKRLSDISSTDEEHKLALDKAEEMMRDLSKLGWTEPLAGDSGNGAHLIYKIDMDKTDENVALIKNVLQALAVKYNTDRLDIDTTVFNPGQITKLFGTHARKGSHIERRPHRLAKIISIPVNSEIVTEDLLQKIIDSVPRKEEGKSTTKSDTSNTDQNLGCPPSIQYLPVRAEIKKLIVNGNQGEYKCRSRADMAVVLELCRKGLDDITIKDIYENTDYRIGEKYREKTDPDQYLGKALENAKKKISETSNLTEEEKDNPLFIQGALYKENNKLRLDIVKLQEHITYKYKLRRFSQVFFLYKDKCYVECNEEEINAKCQGELEEYRYLFKPKDLTEFNHFVTGNTIIKKEDGEHEQSRYLTLQNGLFDLEEEKLINHTSDIFTTNLMDYKYDPAATCPRFLQYLDEVFLSNSETINFVQQAVGYIFHKQIPTAAIFFLIGGGSNGKSVFIILLNSLFGEHNTCKLSLTKFSDERFIPQLFGKMLNISAETPQKKQINTDIVKEVVSGDIVTGRKIFCHPVSFQPYAKHFLAMNKEPEIDDTSHGMWRRVYPIEFLREFSKEEQDVFLIDKLKEELPGIFNWALAGYRILKKNKFKLTETEKMNAKKQQIKELGNSVLKFASEKLKKSSGINTRLSEIYKSYLDYCISEGEKYPKKKSELKNTLKRSGWRIDNSTKEGNSVCMFDTKLV
jgi:P4 family phage/plasmid primase-like protien